MRVKLWKLKDPVKRKECQERLIASLEGCRGDMEKSENYMFITYKVICRETTGRRGWKKRRVGAAMM